MPYRYQVEFDRIINEKRQCEISHGQLLVEYDDLKERFVSGFSLTKM